jgi:hypothetical protein
MADVEFIDVDQALIDRVAQKLWAAYADESRRGGDVDFQEMARIAIVMASGSDKAAQLGRAVQAAVAKLNEHPNFDAASLLEDWARSISSEEFEPERQFCLALADAIREAQGNPLPEPLWYFYIAGEYLEKPPDTKEDEGDPGDWPWEPFESSDLCPNETWLDGEVFAMRASDRETAIERVKILVNEWRMKWWGFTAELWLYPNWPSDASIQKVASWNLC